MQKPLSKRGSSRGTTEFVGHPDDEKYTNNRSAWEAHAKKEAKKAGHSFYHKAYFETTVFLLVLFCALHYKTVKVLDVLQLSMLALTSYDRYCGHWEAIGPTLDRFLEQLQNEPAYKSQLKSFSMDARFMWQKLKVKKGLCHTGNSLKSLESLLKAKEQKNIRLIGRQANVILKDVNLYANILDSSIAAMTARKYNKTLAKKVSGAKTKAVLDSDMEVVLGGINAYLLGIRNLVFWMGRSGLEAYDEKNATHSTYESYVKTCVIKIKEAAAVVEMLQSNLFPEMVRPYDVTATFCMPDVVDHLAVLHLLQGYEGLLEQSEKYHAFINNMPSFRLSKPSSKKRFKRNTEGDKIKDANGEFVYEESATQESRNHYKFGRAWLVDQYFHSTDYCVTKESRLKTKESSAHIIPRSRYPYYDVIKAGRRCHR